MPGFVRSGVSQGHNTSVFALSVALCLASAASAGSAAMIGFLGHVDVINDTGNTGHGFEMDLQGLQRIDMTDT